jgi:anti-sigma regulatory factor (Ser/Thr protein kinase)
MADAFEQAPLVILVVDADELVLRAMNRRGREVLGDRPLGGPLDQWHDLAGQQLLERFREVARTGTTYSGRDWRLELQDDRGQPVEVVADWIISPLLDEEGRVEGVLGLARETEDGLGGRGPSLVELERRYRDTLEVLVEIQDAMLPKGLPVTQGVEVAARYLLAEDYAGAGGDWFDAVPLDDGRLALVVGDVVGHGVEATVTMGGLKTLFDERIRVDGDLAATLDLLGRRAGRVPEARAATVCAAVFDPRTGDLEYCTAGHPAPVVVHDGRATFLPATGAGPLGTARSFPSGRCHLDEGDLLVLYSDGLVERPGRSPVQNTLDLLKVTEDAVRGIGLANPRERLVDRVCRQQVELLTRMSGYTDDITVVALQPVAAVPPLDLHLAALPDAVRTVRADLDEWLAGLHVDDLDRLALQHAVGELVANAVEHAYPEVDVQNPLDVRVCLTATGFIELEVADRGRWRGDREPSAGDAGDLGGTVVGFPRSLDHGRGLAMARGFLDELRVEHGPEGTTARGCHRVTHPASMLRGSTASATRRHEPLRLQEDGARLVVAGAIDTQSGDALRHAIDRVSRGASRPAVVDLTAADMVSSVAVQVLHEAVQGGHVTLLAPVGSVAQRVLDVVRLPYRS